METERMKMLVPDQWDVPKGSFRLVAGRCEFAVGFVNAEIGIYYLSASAQPSAACHSIKCNWCE